jgi:hypothetical protein
MADTGKSAFWSAPRLTAAGDIVLFYVERPISAIVAVGKALSSARPTDDKWYEAKIGEVRLLNFPITLPELRQMFPDWAWLRSVSSRSKSYSFLRTTIASEIPQREFQNRKT